MATATTSLVNLVREVATRLYPGRLVKGTTTSGGSSAAVIDLDTWRDNDANANAYNHVWVRIDELVGAGPAVGTTRLVRDAGFTGSAGQFAVTAFSQTMQSGTDFSLHYTLHPDEVVESINLTLTNTFHKSYHPLVSLITNGDYEDATAGAPDNWTGTNATPTQTSSAAVVPYGRFGQNVLLTSASGFSESAAINVNEGEQYFIWVSVSADIGTATLVVRDTTNGADIVPTASTNEEAFIDLAYQFAIPSGCETITIRLTGTSNSDDADWGPVVLFPFDRVIFDLPRDMDYSPHVTGAFWFPLGTSAGGSGNTNAFRPYERHPRPIPYRPMFDALQANHNRIELDLHGHFDFRGGLSSLFGPVFIEGWRPFATLTEADTSPTTSMNHDTLIVGTLAECHRKIAARLDRMDPEAALTHRRLQAEFDNTFRALLKTNDYVVPTTETVSRRVSVRLP